MSTSSTEAFGGAPLPEPISDRASAHPVVAYGYPPPSTAPDPETAIAQQGNAEEWVWLGSFSGFEVNPDPPGGLYLSHRCGWEVGLHPAGHYLANICAKAMEHRQEGCRP